MTGGIDAAFLVVFAVFAIVLGQPMSMALSNCYALPSDGNGTYSALPVLGGNSSFLDVAGVLNATDNAYLQLENVDPQTACLELNAVWGLTITLAIAFFSSGVFAGMMWIGKRRAAAAGGASSDAEDKWAPAGSSAGGSVYEQQH